MNAILKLSAEQQADLLETLRNRFEDNDTRHTDLSWEKVQSRLAEHPEKLESLSAMEQTGGEPDVVGQDQSTGELIFFDCSPESPSGRRSLCYDEEALFSRKRNKPEGSAITMAAEMGVTLLSEAEYRSLQNLGEFDLKSSSWVLTPPKVRELGGALFCDRRFDTIFTSHNGAESYYAARGFRASLRV
jgi:hypothetical protein